MQYYNFLGAFIACFLFCFIFFLFFCAGIYTSFFHFHRNTQKIDILAGIEGVLLTMLMTEECLQVVQWAPSLGQDVRKGMSWVVALYFPEIMFATMTGKPYLHYDVTVIKCLVMSARI